jgi:hypothetical protein
MPVDVDRFDLNGWDTGEGQELGMASLSVA